MGTYKIDGALEVTTAPTGDNGVVRLSELNDKINYTDINNGLTVVDGKVNANIVKIQDATSTEFTPDENGVVTIPRATNDNLGLFTSKGYLGLDVFGNVGYYLVPASSTEITNRNGSVWKTIQPRSINKAVKAALTDDKRIGTETGTGDWDSNTTFTDTEKDRACEILGASRKLYKHTVNMDNGPYQYFLYFISTNATAYTYSTRNDMLSDFANGKINLVTGFKNYYGAMGFVWSIGEVTVTSTSESETEWVEGDSGPYEVITTTYTVTFTSDFGATRSQSASTPSLTLNPQLSISGLDSLVDTVTEI